MNKGNVNVLSTLKPRVFKSSAATNLGKAGFLSETRYDSEISVGSTSSYRYDPIGTGIKSTQQLNVDWGDFAQHTFFNSAQVKTNEAFKKIINEFPFDGTKIEYEEFVDSLTGFQNYVLSELPVNYGYYYSDGAGYITVKDYSGLEHPSSSLVKTGKSVLNPGTGSFSTEMWLWVPSQSNGNSVVYQKVSGSNGGISCWLSSSTSTLSASCGLTINSGSVSIGVSESILKNQWNHIAFSWDRVDGSNDITMFLNGAFAASSDGVEIEEIDFSGANLYIFSGSSFTGTNGTTFIPTEILSGAIDEFRWWGKTLDTTTIANSSTKNIYAQDNLSLYYRFNEPADASRSIILDHSGNSLFGSHSTRSFATSSIGSTPMTYEQSKLNPVLFTTNTDLTSLKTTLLTSASLYDSENPSLITNLIPEHYLVEGKLQEGLSTETGEVTTTLNSDSIPRTATLGDTQVLLSLLYSTATFFDEIQLYIKEFGNLIHIDYDDTSVISDYFLQVLAQRYGIELPPIFNGADLDQFVDGENISDVDSSTETYNLKYIQNKIWKKILINAKDILNSKGTRHSINLFLRSVGIEPNSVFKIKEYGGPTQKTLTATREQRQDIVSLLGFTTSSYVTSSYLSSSRVEPGFPLASSTPGDGLLTSGSWTYEGIYKMNSTSSYASQSLVRLSTKLTASNQEVILANLLTDGSSSLKLVVQPNTSLGSSEALVLYLSGNFNVFDGALWNVSFGKQRSDEILENTSPSSSFFVRLAKQSYGEILESYATSAFFNDNSGSYATNLLTAIPSSLYTTSGSFLSWGSSSVSTSSLASAVGPTTYFDGKLGEIRFWSKYATQTEWFEHVRNFKSIGTDNPLVTNQFERTESGSFEKIRLHCSITQPITESNSSGEITLFDFSQNNNHCSGSGFDVSTRVIMPQIMYYSFLSTNFDEAVTYSKVRVRSLNELTDINDPFVEQAPLYELGIDEQPTDNSKLSIDFSIAETLNQDMANIFGSYDVLNNVLGDPANMFSTDYVGLENLRKAYFNRLTDSINLKSFFEMYKWFDESLGTFISQLIGRNVKYKGVNFVIQPHMLERSKVKYYFYNQYLNRSLNSTSRDVLTIQLLNGTITKF